MGTKTVTVIEWKRADKEKPRNIFCPCLVAKDGEVVPYALYWDGEIDRWVSSPSRDAIPRTQDFTHWAYVAELTLEEWT